MSRKSESAFLVTHMEHLTDDHSSIKSYELCNYCAKIINGKICPSDLDNDYCGMFLEGAFF